MTYTHDQFLAKVQAKHGDHISFVTVFQGTKTPISIQCSAGHAYETKPEYLLQYGCKHCGYATQAKSSTMTTTDYKAKLKAKFGAGKILLGEYAGSYTPIAHRCQCCKQEYLVAPQDMINARKLPWCVSCNLKGRADGKRLSLETVTTRIAAKHAGTVLLVGKYTNSLDKHTFSCLLCEGTWQTTPDAVMRISGCPHCNSPLKHSQVGVRWVEEIAKRLRIKFEHAANGGERHLYGASGKRYYVDGFNARKKLVLEFNGDAWHGNPALFKAKSTPHPFSTKTAKQLHRDTVNKMTDLTAAGYRVIGVWEADYRKGLLVTQELSSVNTHLKTYL